MQEGPGHQESTFCDPDLPGVTDSPRQAVRNGAPRRGKKLPFPECIDPRWRQMTPRGSI